jgi:hypothetical protein
MKVYSQTPTSLLRLSRHELLLLGGSSRGWECTTGGHYQATAAEDSKRLRGPSVSYTDV